VLTHAYVHRLADVHLAGFAPAFPLSFHDRKFARKPPVPIASVVRGKRKKKEEKEFVLESNDVKSRIFELIWLATNLLLIGKYFLDKFTIQCEPCIDLNDCPPCQTDFMKKFWLYMLILNLVFSIGLVVKNRIKKRK